MSDCTHTYSAQQPLVTCVSDGKRRWDLRCRWRSPPSNISKSLKHHRDQSKIEACAGRLFSKTSAQAAKLASQHQEGFAYAKHADGSENRAEVVVQLFALERLLGSLEDDLGKCSKLSKKVRSPRRPPLQHVSIPMPAIRTDRHRQLAGTGADRDRRALGRRPS